MRRALTVGVETIFGILIVFAMVTAVDCLPRVKQRLAQSVAAADVAPGSCSPQTAPALLCGTVTRDGKHECAICVERNCFTTTQVYCAKSCDDPACVVRAK